MPMPIETTDPTLARRGPYVARAAGVAGLFGLLVLLLVGGSVPCVFASLTGRPCPGCGSTRAIYALAAGDLPAFARANPLGPLMALVVGAFGVHAVWVVLRDGSADAVASGRVGRLLARAALAIGVAEIALWIARFLGAFSGPVEVF